MTQEQIKKQMAQNSANWHTADDSGKKKLHEENVALAARLDTLTGGNSGFDSGTGRWDLSRSGQNTPLYQAATLTGAKDQSDYLRQMYEARTESALADLKGAYEKNVLDLDHTETQLAPTYQAARNKTASISAVEKRNFAEYAAARGLGSGASAQAELARGISLQGNLTSLNQSEAADRSEIQLQRSKLLSEYNNAIAKARASGNTQLASSLYQEMTRLDEAMMRTELNQSNLDHRAYQSDLTAQRHQVDDAHWEHEQDYKSDQDQKSWDYQTERDAIADQRYADETNYQRQQDALKWARENNRIAFDNAMAKWKTLGYLDGESAKVLGLPKGTRTSDQIYQTARIIAMQR
ncbi:MAG: hypothetical protein ACOX0U_04885 [Oscillospiraceae bacterium]|jgi:hypothetical protein